MNFFSCTKCPIVVIASSTNDLPLRDGKCYHDFYVLDEPPLGIPVPILEEAVAAHRAENEAVVLFLKIADWSERMDAIFRFAIHDMICAWLPPYEAGPYH